MTEQRMPPQKQSQAGRHHLMEPAPDSSTSYRAAGKLEDQVALVSGCDSQPEEVATCCVFLASNDSSS